MTGAKTDGTGGTVRNRISRRRGRKPAPTLIGAMRRVGVPGWDRIHGMAMADAPPSGSFARSLGMNPAKGPSVPGGSIEALKAAGRVIGEADGVSLVAFADVVATLDRFCGRLAVVTDRRDARAAPYAHALALLAGEEWLDAAAIASRDAPPTDAAWLVMSGRVEDVMAAFPAEGIEDVHFVGGKSVVGGPVCCFPGHRRRDQGGSVLVHRLACHAYSAMGYVGMLHHDADGCRSLASGWWTGPATGTIDHPAPMALSSASVAAAIARPARTRILDWLAGDGSAAALAAEARTLWAVGQVG